MSLHWGSAYNSPKFLADYCIDLPFYYSQLGFGYVPSRTSSLNNPSEVVIGLMDANVTFFDAYGTDRDDTRKEPLLTRTQVVLHVVYVFFWVVECALNFCGSGRQRPEVRTEIPVDRVLET